MIIRVIVMVLITFISFMLIREFIKIILPKQVIKLDNTVFNGIDAFLARGTSMYNYSHMGKNMSFNAVVKGTLWDIAHKSFQCLDPAKRITKQFEGLIEETTQALENAMENAKKRGSQEALDYVLDCMQELQGLSQDIYKFDNLDGLKRKMQDIKDHADLIAATETFTDTEPQDDEKSYWEILGLKEGSSETEIKKAYRNMVQKYHPDKCNHLGEDLRKFAEERFKEINEAYHVLIP